MGLFSALFAGVNGINSNGNVISVIGDNIANVNTIGYKGSRAVFEDILAGSDTNIGLGSRVADINGQFNQGGFESSSSVTDLAIDGEGFFVVQSDDGSQFYTRAGQFSVNKDGDIVNQANQVLQGFTVDASNDVTSQVGDMTVSTTPIPPHSTSEITLQMNLDSDTVVGSAFSVVNPTGTSNFSAGITAYDSLGNGHLVTMYYRKTTATRTWSWYAVVAQAEITSATADKICAQGTVKFSSSGGLQSSTTTSSDFDFLNAAQNQAITFDFGSGVAGVTQFGSDSAVINIGQDGYASGSLKSIEIDSDGTISGNFTNGQTQTLGQVLLATFNNREGLKRVGNNNYQETLDSGVPVLGSPASAGKGSIVSSTLEQSNVDLANELIKMVIIQRGFQANSRTISTVNDMLAQLVTLGQ